MPLQEPGIGQHYRATNLPPEATQEGKGETAKSLGEKAEQTLNTDRVVFLCEAAPCSTRQAPDLHFVRDLRLQTPSRQYLCLKSTGLRHTIVSVAFH